VLVGKGANNQKGKEMAQLAALISIKRVTGTLPVNVVFIADHDEERMEVGLRQFMFDHPELFQDVDVAFGYAGAQRADGMGEIVGQSVGTVVFDLEARNPTPGPWPQQQPMWRLVEALEEVFRDDSPLLQEIRRDVSPPSPDEEAFLRREVELSGGRLTFEQAMRIRTDVRVSITGLWGGNMAAGYAGNYVPPVATAKLDVRFPPEVDGEEVVERIRAELNRRGYHDLTMNVIGIVPWSWANADNEMGHAIRRMYDQFGVPYNEPPAGNYMGTWTPYGPPYLFTRAPLSVPHLRGGLGYGWGSHYGPEFYVIEGDGERIYGFAGAAKSYATVLYNYAGRNPPGGGGAR
jgi:acetylornithine deacetylase/succinyl-diaminopimelate desuccinylase-like protein